MYNIELLNGHRRRGSFEFEFESEGNDSKESFEKNLKEQPADWEWRNTIVTYTYNKQGYRTLNWENSDWDNSVLLFGGSDVVGTGVQYKQTVGWQLSELISTPVINLGRGGSGSMFQWVNTVKLCQTGIKPKAVIYIWPQPNRCLEFIDDTGLNTKEYGAWDEDKNFGTSWVLHDHHGTCYRNYVIDCCNILWKCPVLHYDRYPTPNLGHLAPSVDKSRDTFHPGPKTYGIWANTIKNDLSGKILF